MRRHLWGLLPGASGVGVSCLFEGRLAPASQAGGTSPRLVPFDALSNNIGHLNNMVLNFAAVDPGAGLLLLFLLSNTVLMFLCLV